MIVIVAFVLVLLTVPLANGRLSLIADLKVIALWSVFAALFIQIGIINIFGEKIPEAVAQVVHLGTYALASWFLIANRRIHGLMTIGIGAALNLVAISANNGVMPASPAAASSAGLAHSAEKFANSAATPNARFALLGDIFAIPHGVPLANVFSIGDVLLVVGAAWLLHYNSRSSLSGGSRKNPTTYRGAIETEYVSPARRKQFAKSLNGFDRA